MSSLSLMDPDSANKRNTKILVHDKNDYSICTATEYLIPSKDIGQARGGKINRTTQTKESY